MKVLNLPLLFLLFAFSVKAQSYTLILNKTVVSINKILDKAKMVRFTNSNYDAFYPAKIKANLQGDVFCVDSFAGGKTISTRSIFNLFKVKSFVIKGTEIKAVGQNQKPIVRIFIANSYTKSLKKEMDALWHVCDTYSKLDIKYKCE